MAKDLRTTLTLRTSPAFHSWLKALARSQGKSASRLIEEGLGLLADRIGIDSPPARMTELDRDRGVSERV